MIYVTREKPFILLRKKNEPARLISANADCITNIVKK